MPTVTPKTSFKGPPARKPPVKTVAPSKPAPKKPLMVNFREDTLTTVSRATVKHLAVKLGFNDTQTVLYALARLRDQVLSPTSPAAGNDFEPLTPQQHQVIAKAAPKAGGKVLSTLLD